MKGSPSVILNDKTIVGKASEARGRLYKVIEKKVWRGLRKATGERQGEKRQAIETSEEKWSSTAPSVSLAGRRDGDKEWEGQRKLTKWPDCCEKKGSLPPSLTGQNNSTISGLRSPTLLTPVSSRDGPTSFGGLSPLADGSKQTGIYFQMLASER